MSTITGTLIDWVSPTIIALFSTGPPVGTWPSCTTTTGGSPHTCRHWSPCWTPTPRSAWRVVPPWWTTAPTERCAGRSPWARDATTTSWTSCCMRNGSSCRSRRYGAASYGQARRANGPSCVAPISQFFLSAADAGWGLYYLPDPLAHWVQHREQSGAWRGSDYGLGVADDVLAFWDSWLQGRPDAQAALANRQRARWHLRRARALLLAGRAPEARTALDRASALRRASSLDRPGTPRPASAVGGVTPADSGGAGRGGPQAVCIRSNGREAGSGPSSHTVQSAMHRTHVEWRVIRARAESEWGAL